MLRVRRAVISAISVAGLVLGGAGAAHAGTVTVTVKLVNGTNGCTLSAKTQLVKLGQDYKFVNDTGATQQVHDRAKFWSFSVAAGSSVTREMAHSGKFLWTCDGGTDYTGLSVAVFTPSSTTHLSFLVTWANSSAYSGYTYSVQYKVGKKGTIKTWYYHVSIRSATFTGKAGNTYYFRAASVRTSTAKSQWSPWRAAVVQ